MLSKEDRHHIYQQAYLPEQLPDYVAAVSGTKPYLIENHICYCHRRHMMFIGFPLGDPTNDTVQTYLAACEHFKPATIAIIAPKIWLSDDTHADLTTIGECIGCGSVDETLLELIREYKNLTSFS